MLWVVRRQGDRGTNMCLSSRAPNYIRKPLYICKIIYNVLCTVPAWPFYYSSNLRNKIIDHISTDTDYTEFSNIKFCPQWLANNVDFVPINPNARRSYFWGKARGLPRWGCSFVGSSISRRTASTVDLASLNILRKVSLSYAGVTVSTSATIRTLFLLCLSALKQRSEKLIWILHYFKKLSRLVHL